MTTKKDWSQALDELTDLVGKPEAKRLLVLEGISVGTADKLVGRRYPSQPRHLVAAAIHRALEATKPKAS
jgi:hypothetical protein